jgi:hypothetical protein
LKPVVCTRKTVDLAAELYKTDLAMLGYSLDDAYRSCEKYNRPFPPTDGN